MRNEALRNNNPYLFITPTYKTFCKWLLSIYHAYQCRVIYKKIKKLNFALILYAQIKNFLITMGFKRYCHKDKQSLTANITMKDD